MLKKSLLLMLFVALLAPWAAKAQTLSEYTVTTGSETYTTIVGVEGTTQLTSVTGDSGTQKIDLPFEFKFGETTYEAGTKVTVRADGYLFFGSTGPGDSSKSAWTSSTNYYVIAPFLNYDGRINRSGAPTGGAYYTIVNDVNDNPEMLVIEFVNVECYYSPYGLYNFQIRLYNNGNISAVYGESTLSTYNSMSHNFFLVNGKSDKICLTGSYAEPVVGAPSSLPNFTVAPVAGQVITYVRPVFTCPKPTLNDVANEDIEANSAIIRWVPSSEDQTLFDIYYSTASTPAPDEETTPSYSNVSGTSKEIEGLTSGTVYYVWLRGNCGTASDPDISGGWTASKQFQTDCGTVASHTWGFEAPNTGGTTSNPLPACWTRPTTGASTTYPKSTNSNAKTGSYSLFFYSSSTPSTPAIGVLPQIEGGVNGKRLAFYEKGAYSFQVGYMTDPTDASTFVAVFTQTGTSSYPTTPYIVDFSEYSGNPSYIAIKSNFTSTQTYSSIYFDDVTLSDTPNCLEPTITGVTNITTATASLSWTAGNAGQDHWDIYHSLDPTAPTTTTSPTIENTDLNPYPLSGLQHSSTYYVWVRGNCGGELSGWSNVYSFPTDCEAISSMNETFESYSTGNFDDPCWQNETIEEGTGSGSIYLFQISTDNQGGNSTKKMKLPDMKNGTMTKLRLPEMNLPNNNYQFVLDVYRDSNSKADEGIRVFASANGEITGATELAFIPHYYNYAPIESSSGWYTYELPIGMSGTCYIIIRGESKYGTATYMDNFVIEPIPTCPKPKNPTCTAKTAHTATLSWTNGNEEDAWQIAVGTTTDFDPASVTPIDVTTNPVTINGLTANTQYYAYVRANCGGGDMSVWSKTYASFKTTIGNAVPTALQYDPNSVTSSEVLVSWTGVTTNDLHESYDVYYDLSTVTAVPDEPAAPNLIAGITENSKLITGLSAETGYHVWVRDNCGDDGYSAWYATPITFTTASNCQTPDGLTFSAITSSSFTVDWADHGTISNWNVRYSSDGGTTWNYIENATKPCPIGSLTQNTEYRVQVQATCNPDPEVWSTYATCKTAYGVPFTEEFSNTSIPTNWENKTGFMSDIMSGAAFSSSTQWTFGTGSNNVFNSHATINIYGGISESNARKGWLITPNITLGTNYSLSFDMALTTYSSSVTPQPQPAQTTGTDDKFVVLISTDNEATWTVVRQWDNASSAYVYNDISTTGETIYLDLAAYNNQTVRIAFYGESTIKNADNNLHIDNVEVNITTTCHKPTNVAASNVTNHSATITWTPGTTEQTSWVLKYNMGSDFDPMTEGTQVPDEITTPSYTFNKVLEAAKVYYVYVRGNCGGEDSPWSKKCTFNTAAAAPAPTTFAKTDVGPDWVDLYWNAPAGDYLSGYGLYYSTESTQPAQTDDAIVTINDPTAPTADNPYRLPGLENATKYYIWVRANHEANVYSSWKAITGSYFTTLTACPTPTNLAANNILHTSADLTWTGYSDSYTVQKRTAGYQETYFFDDFEDGFDANGWTIYTEGQAPYTDGWVIYSYDAVSGDNSAIAFSYYNSTNYNADNWLITPQLDLQGTLKFWQRIASSSWPDAFEVLLSTTGKNISDFTITLRDMQDGDDDWTEIDPIDLSAYAGQKGYIAIHHVSNGQYYLMIDDFGIYGADVPEGEWENVTTTATDGACTIPDLNAGTKYDVKVKGNCGGEYSNVYTFTTIDENKMIFTTAGYWNVADNWTPAIPTSTQDAIIRANVTVPAEYDAVANIVTFEGTTTPTLTIKDGGQIHINNIINATIEKYIEGYGDDVHVKTGWNLISTSMWQTIENADFAEEAVNLISTNAEDYDLYYFNGEAVDKEWVNYKDDDHDPFGLGYGNGYLYANANNTTLQFTNLISMQLNDYDLDNGIINNGNVLKHDAEKPFGKLNLVGNSLPHTGYVYYGTVDGDNFIPADEMYYCKMNAAGNEIIISNNEVGVCEGIFVVATGAEQYAVVTSVEQGSSKAMASSMNINITNEIGLIDAAIVRFGQGNGLNKFQLDAKHTKVYIPQNDKDFAVVYTEAEGEMPLNFKAETTGKYTISFKLDGANVGYMHLIDKLTGEDVNLLINPEYSFVGSPRDAEDRFIVRFSETSANDCFVYQNDDQLIVNGEGTLQVYDVMGRFVASYEVNGNMSINASQFSNAVYIFRMVGTDVKTQKIVVR